MNISMMEIVAFLFGFVAVTLLLRVWKVSIRKEATMSATDELRHLLDERGVEWVDDSNAYVDVTEFVNNGIKLTIISKNYINPEHDWVTLRTERITPEQAIAATLGVGECNIIVKDNLAETERMGDVWLECDACNWQMPLEPSTPLFNFCPNCGRKVK